MEDQFPEKERHQILHARLGHPGFVLMGSDVTSPDRQANGNTISLSLQCETPDEIAEFFNRLSDGAEIAHPLQEFYAGIMGALTDKFEKDWLLYCETKKTNSLPHEKDHPFSLVRPQG
jgi:PhnB protein